MNVKTVGVVGGGIAGLSASKALAERGHRVTLFEQFPSNHANGSSHGKTRIIRRAYPDPFYTDCMREAYPLWDELEQASGKKLVNEVGLMMFGERSSELIVSTEAGLREFDVDYEKVDHKSVGRLFPALRLDLNDVGLYTPEAGWVDAESTMDALRELGEIAGVSTVSKKVALNDLADFDQVIVTAGGWIREWWQEAPVNVTLQTFCYLEANIQGPVWIDASENLFYGFPSDASGQKIGMHRQGRTIEPSDADRAADPRVIELVIAFAKNRFGFREDIGINQVTTCIYTNTPTEDFLIRRIDERTLVASACSGHGFKFGPWFGRLLADLVDGKADLGDYPRFVSG